MTAKGWGPQYGDPGHRGGIPPGVQIAMLFALLALSTYVSEWLIFGACIGLAVAIRVVKRAGSRALATERSPMKRISVAADRLDAVIRESAAQGGGVFLGVDDRGGWRFSRQGHAVLLLGPPRSGKSAGVIVPSVLSHPGPVVSASTKPDVVRATHDQRARVGAIWEFDPTGSGEERVGQTLRWSPVPFSREWDGALLMARAMVAGAAVGAGTTDQSHWAKRAQALLAPMLHAAALNGRDVAHVLDWVIRHELDEPGLLLEERGSPVAMSMLIGVLNTEAREQSSIFSAASDALDAYTSDAALAAARQPNFEPDQLTSAADTIFIRAPAERQAAAAPLVCGLLAEIRRATYDAFTRGALKRPMLFALDEAANIAPMPELPAIASEGGGQGLVLLASFQDLSQARARWGTAADGFLTLFGSKVILPGIADRTTLESISLALGEYDRKVQSTTGPRSWTGLGGTQQQTISIQRQRVLSPGEIANIPAGHLLHLDGVRWELLGLSLAHRDEPWRSLTQTPAQPMAAS